jgi:CDP-diacylglycerol--glycerol-3-phosphate 3-phosphatidyltransferase
MNIANKISTFRILIVPFFVACLVFYAPGLEYLRWTAFVLFVLAVVSDAVDGYIARKERQVSTAGQILDPLGDKLLLMSAFITLSLRTQFPLTIPLWVSFIVISRDAIILLGALVIYLVKQKIDIYPTRWGKLTTTFQMLSVIAVLLQMPHADLVWTIAVFFTVVSGMDYIRRGFRILYATDTHRNNR